MPKPTKQSLSVTHLEPGSFEYIEAKIRRDADGTEFGKDFEWLCKWFLENAPRYRGQFQKVWLWNDWPDRWSGDKGVDIVALDRAGNLWAIQAKAYSPHRSLRKSEVDSFLSDSSRPEIAFRLLIATTDKIGANAYETLRNQEKPVGFVFRGDLISEQIAWPTKIGKPAVALPRWKPRPHQATAIRKIEKGFKTSDRGQLIMACGTGKTLTALWIAEKLKSRRTLVLAPSLLLVGQNLVEWGRHAAEDFDALVVCSDLSISDRKNDPAIQSVANLGVKPTTDPVEVRRFLNKRRRRPAVVFSTYQSSEQIAAAQGKGSRAFDLVICDEAHRLAGKSGGGFATILDGEKIKAQKRLFMTATPRYIKDQVKQRAAELEYELVSMDDEHVFGPEFHELTFHEAITADPPLLTDYQVVVIGVTDHEAREWAEQGILVRTDEGLKTDARSLAARIGLAKAIKQYDLRRMISFHSSVAKAKAFVAEDRDDSLLAVLPHLSRSSRPTGKLWARHISGHTPMNQRLTLLRGLGDLPEKSRGIISNCACLGEGVDVPVLDGIAFIDPKRSIVDIIQAVGRVIRKAEGKEIGTVVIPFLIDETQDADLALSNSVFKPVWQVLNALRFHDNRLADALDELRLSLGRSSKNRRRISLPDNIRFDCPRRLLEGFEQAFYVRAVMKTTSQPPLTIDQVLAWADAHKERTGEWPTNKSAQVKGTDEKWSTIHISLSLGRRGLPGGSSLAKLLAEHRNVRNLQDLPELTIDQVLAWADAHKAQTGNWPTHKTGPVKGTDEKWSAIEGNLSVGNRGLPGGSSVAKLLAQHRGIRNEKDLPELTIDQVLAWADAHKAQTGNWPTHKNGPVKGTDEKWSAIEGNLSVGNRGLPGGSSVAKLLAQHRGIRNEKDLPELTIDQVLAWADAHKAQTGNWPTHKNGPVKGTDEKWSAIRTALGYGQRGLPGGSSLAKLLAEHRNVRNRMNLADLTIDQILAWADAQKKRTGMWPIKGSGQLEESDETWLGIDSALRRGSRSLHRGTSLAKLLARHRGVRNIHDLAPLNIKQILAWADQHHALTGNWPKIKSGEIEGTDETWLGINHAFRRGSRGLPGGSSLAILLDKYRRIND